MTREQLALAACEGVPDDMLQGVRMLALLEKSQTLLNASEGLKANAAECLRMLEVVTRELLTCTELYRRDVVQVPLDATPVERCEVRMNAAIEALRREQPEVGAVEVVIGNDGKAMVVGYMKGEG